MNQVELFEDRVIGDIAKGRFPKAKVREIIEELCRIKGLDISRRVFEYSLLSKYIYGIKRPSEERKEQIKQTLRDLGKELMAV